MTPLLKAVDKKNEQIIHILLEKGANTDLANKVILLILSFSFSFFFFQPKDSFFLVFFFSFLLLLFHQLKNGVELLFH